MTNQTDFEATISASIRVMSKVLTDANAQIDQARDYIAQHEQNVAIGTMLGVEDLLGQALNLYKAIITIHCLDK